MLDHMLFNRLKWWNISGNDEQVSANGKNFLAIPSSFTICKGAELQPWKSYEGSFYAEEDTQVKCIGRGTTGYFFVGNVKANSLPSLDSASYYTDWHIDQGAGGPGFVHNADIKNVIWGVKAF